MKTNNAIWLYNEAMSPTAGNGETNLLSPLGGAAIGAEAPIVIYNTKTDAACLGRIEAAAFLRLWANAILQEG